MTSASCGRTISLIYIFEIYSLRVISGPPLHPFVLILSASQSPQLSDVLSLSAPHAVLPPPVAALWLFQQYYAHFACHLFAFLLNL